MEESGVTRNNMKRSHEVAGLMPTMVEENMMRGNNTFSDDEDLDSCDGSVGRPSTPGPKPGKKTRGRVKINMEFIDNKLRRYTTFSKRKSGIMKKAHELATLTGTQVMLLVASETGHVYTFATRKLQPILSSEAGKQLIQTCLNSPDSPESNTSSSNYDRQRMSAQGFEEPDLSYAPPEETKEGLLQKTYHNMLNNMSGQGSRPAIAMEHNTAITSVSPQTDRSNSESPMNLVAVNNPKMALVTVNNSNPNSSRAHLATFLSGSAYIMSGSNQNDGRSLQFGQNDPHSVRSSSGSSSGMLSQPTLLQQPTITVQPVLWTPALHAQPITVIPSHLEEKKDEKG